MPTPSEELITRALEVMAKPQSVQSGAEKMDQHRLADYARLLEAIAGAVDPTVEIPSSRGLRFTQLKSGGCGGD